MQRRVRARAGGRGAFASSRGRLGGQRASPPADFPRGRHTGRRPSRGRKRAARPRLRCSDRAHLPRPSPPLPRPSPPRTGTAATRRSAASARPCALGVASGVRVWVRAWARARGHQWRAQVESASGEAPVGAAGTHHSRPPLVSSWRSSNLGLLVALVQAILDYSTHAPPETALGLLVALV